MILRIIRTCQLRSLFFPVILLLTALWLSFLLPWPAFLFPKTLNPLLPIDASPQKNAFYQVMPNLLYYTGCDAQADGQVNGHYYYSMTADRCQIFLLPRQKNGPAPCLEQISLKGKLKEQQELLYQITDSMAKELSWSQRRILELTSPYILDAISDSGLLNRTLYLLLPACIFFSSAGILRLLFYAFFPRLYPPLRRIQRETGDPYILTALEQELKKCPAEQIPFLYLTEHYLINLADGNFLFQPLENICWIYTHTYFSGLPRQRRRGKFYFAWWNRSGKHFEIPLPPDNSGEAMMEIIKARYPDVLIHYSQQNKRSAEKILKKKILYV